MIRIRSNLTVLVLLSVIAYYPAQCRLPRFPESLSVKPEFGAYLDYKDEDRIVGGEDAPEFEFPYQASLQRKSSSGFSHFCGATVVSSRLLLTAAHCVHGRKASSFEAVVGTTQLYQPPFHTKSGSRYRIKSVWVHEEYDSATVDYDMALLELYEDMTWDPFLQPLRIPQRGAEFEPGQMANVSGWGTMQEGGSLPTRLRYVTVPIFKHEECIKNYHSQDVTERMLCAGLDEGGKDSCQGDSGGPLVMGNKLIGIVSWGYGCARPTYPGVYTKVSALTDWVQEKSKGVIKVAQD